MAKKRRTDNFAGVVLGIVGIMLVVQSAFVFQIVQSNFRTQQNEEIIRYVDFISEALDDSVALTKDYERLQNENLYEKSKNLRYELESLEAVDISSEILQAYKDEYDLAGLAVLASTGDDVIIVNSTFTEEIGTSTKSWRYWYEAFTELLNGQAVSVDKGMSKKDFWVGPKSLSYIVDGYYRYGYIYNPRGQYLINVIVQDENFISAHAAGSVNKTLEDIRDQVGYIDHIGIVNANTLRTYKSSKYEGTGQDPLVAYGDLERTGFTYVDYNVDELMETDKMFIAPLGHDNEQLIVKKLNDQDLVVVITNTVRLDQLIHIILVGFILLGLVAGLFILGANYGLIRRYGATLEVEKKRLRLAQAFQNTIARMPAILYQCRLSKTGELILTYNEGVAFEEDEIIMSSENAVPMNHVYPVEFMEIAKPEIMEAFKNKRVRFESSMNGHVFDNLVSPVLDAGYDEETGRVYEVIGFGTEISERVEREKSAIYLASHDMLTGLSNRRSFKTLLNKWLRESTEVHVIYFDLNDFKQINDKYGHRIGDEVLKIVGGRFNLYSNDAFHIARLGGDEFVACSYDLTPDEVKTMTVRIQESISMPIILEDIECKVGSSIGISQYPMDGTTPEALINAADRAMYEHKSQGRNQL